MKYFIYILFSKKSNIYYVGYSANVENRLLQHNVTSQNTFTSKHRPWEISAIFEVIGSESEAMKIEKFIKNQKSKNFIEKIINPETELKGVLAQLVRVPKLRD